MDYRVTWEIDLDADSPAHAAELALEIMRDPESSLPCFTVKGEDGKTVTVDMLKGSKP